MTSIRSWISLHKTVSILKINYLIDIHVYIFLKSCFRGTKPSGVNAYLKTQVYMAKRHCYLYRYPLSSDWKSWPRRVGTVLEQMPRACDSSANAASVIPESIVHRFAIN